MHTGRDSKIGFLTRRLLKIFRLERVTIAFGKARVKTKILTQSRRSQQPIFELCSVYTDRDTKYQLLSHVRYNFLGVSMLRFLMFFYSALSLFSSQVNAHNLSILTMFRDEGPYLKEWIEYHRLIGVDHFLLYNDRSSDNWEEVLSPYIESGLVEVIPWHKAPTTALFPGWQTAAYQDGLNRSRGQTRWMAFIDVDEFIIPMKENTLVECLDTHFSDTSAVYVSWRNFGTSGIYIPFGESIITKLTKCSLRTHPRNIAGKTIVRPEDVIINQTWSPHIFVMKPEAIYRNGDRNILYFKESDILLDGKHHDKYIRINHYALRDENYYQNVRLPKAISKEYGDINWLKESYELFNMVSDDTIIRFLKQKHPEAYKNFLENNL